MPDETEESHRAVEFWPWASGVTCGRLQRLRCPSTPSRLAKPRASRCTRAPPPAYPVRHHFSRLRQACRRLLEGAMPTTLHMCWNRCPKRHLKPLPFQDPPSAVPYANG
ncbi:hypothetical protein BU26DRAFT_201450 [Trematosphaeria pertusa]|uniref:Uncharacterized protein n=1 Tax=Trematosphaeria pertusa TaxID=390896 RepID=A0A6A6HSW8_9PLEO|nr:uncharacterized protein BU26DRAFT_201450 [Trematosphaeria pertusa]KAF2240868.1 hypothetical protein BU26DRAFT_201450 [Trematosphaeria pertusa]